MTTMSAQHDAAQTAIIAATTMTQEQKYALATRRLPIPDLLARLDAMTPLQMEALRQVEAVVDLAQLAGEDLSNWEDELPVIMGALKQARLWKDAVAGMVALVLKHEGSLGTLDVDDSPAMRQACKPMAELVGYLHLRRHAQESAAPLNARGYDPHYPFHAEVRQALRHLPFDWRAPDPTCPGWTGIRRANLTPGQALRNTGLALGMPLAKGEVPSFARIKTQLRRQARATLAWHRARHLGLLAVGRTSGMPASLRATDLVSDLGGLWIEEWPLSARQQHAVLSLVRGMIQDAFPGRMQDTE